VPSADHGDHGRGKHERRRDRGVSRPAEAMWGGEPGEPLLSQESALVEDQVVDLARRELHRPGTPTLLLGTPFFFFLIRERQFYSYNKYTVPYSLVSTKKGHP